ncbi:MAG: DNA-binding transcriptional regulator Fis [Gammaproteobacteria bacterium]|nr:DNA-binding transcriptional regulator Fis [Gammaproteobacteria bacterium]NNJ51158.1 DNA-binding transcriptional regulator Fis [Gammaproteobacteria bacterium]
MSDQDFQATTADMNHTGENQTQEISQLSHAVKHSIRRYLFELEGTQPNDMYDLVLRQIEQPLFEAILEHTKGNQSRAAEMLGLNRGTLRKKLRSYNLHK